MREVTNISDMMIDDDLPQLLMFTLVLSTPESNAQLYEPAGVGYALAVIHGLRSEPTNQQLPNGCGLLSLGYAADIRDAVTLLVKPCSLNSRFNPHICLIVRYTPYIATRCIPSCLT